TTVVRPRDEQALRSQQAESPRASEIRHVEPGGLLGANCHYRDVACRNEARLAQSCQRTYSGYHTRSTVEVTPLRNAVEVRPDENTRRIPILPRQCHGKIPDRIDRYLQADLLAHCTYDVVRSLLAGTITVPHDTASPPGGAVELPKQSLGEVK